MTELRLMALGGLVLLYGLVFGRAFGITALYKGRARQRSALPAVVEEASVDLFSGAAPAYTLSGMTPLQGGPWRGNSF
jgi:hypothetical protein